MATSEGIPSSIDIEFLELNDNPYITNVDAVIVRNPFVRDYTFIDIPLVVDGGNMVFCKGLDNNEEVHYVVMTEKVLAENAKLERSQIESIIVNAFQEPRLNIVWLPWDKEDVFGHTDGIVRYVGINDKGKPKVLVNLELYDDDIADAMYMALSRHFEIVELHLDSYDELSWAYINSLQTKDFIIIPGIGGCHHGCSGCGPIQPALPQVSRPHPSGADARFRPRQWRCVELLYMDSL